MPKHTNKSRKKPKKIKTPAMIKKMKKKKK